MTKYTVVLAYDVPCYATLIVEADNEDDAETVALKISPVLFEPDWSARGDVRVDIITPDEEAVQTCKVAS